MSKIYKQDNMTIHNADCMAVMAGYEDNYFDLCVTSPPYDNLRDYGKDFFGWGPRVWKPIIKDLYRVIKGGGVVVWVVADATIKGSETGTSFEQALYFKECGFNLHDTMIYKKTGGGARGSNLSYWQNFEYMFIWTIGRPNTFNGIKEKSIWAGASTRPTHRDNKETITLGEITIFSF